MLKANIAKVWNAFNDIYEGVRSDRRVVICDGPEYRSIGLGTIIVPSDKFTPTIHLHVFQNPDIVSIVVKDRHGDNIVGYGRTIGYYRIPNPSERIIHGVCQHIERVFMQYNKQNPVPASLDPEEIDIDSEEDLEKLCPTPDFDPDEIELKEFRRQVEMVMRQSIGSDYVGRVLASEINNKSFCDDVLEDVKLSSAWKDEGYYNDDDIRLAIGRVLCERLGIQ